jgi:DNA-binding response OmpR family regulator
MSTSGADVSGATRVLVVDDYQDGADSLALMVRALGGDARAAYSGEEAIQSAMAFQPQLILLDLTLPGVSGLDAARTLRQMLGATMRLVAVSGWSDESTKQQTLDGGFDEYVVKPIGLDKVQALIAELSRYRTAM